MRKWIAFEKRAVRIGLSLTVTLFLLALCAISFATDKHPMQDLPAQISFSIDTSQLEKWVKKYEELAWFIVSRNKEISLVDHWPSSKMFGSHSPYFDRVAMGLKTLHTFLFGKYEDYLELVIHQPKEKRLEWVDFQDLQAHACEIMGEIKEIKQEEIIEVLEMAIILHEMGHSDTARTKAWIYDIQAKDHLEFIQKVILHHPEIFPSFDAMSLPMKKILTHVFMLASFQEEAVYLHDAYRVFEEVKKSGYLSQQKELFELSFLLNLCFTVSKKGNLDPISSPIFTKYTYRNLQAVKKAFFLLQEYSEKEVYQFYLDKRASWLDLDPGSSLNRALTHVGSMMELYTTGEGKTLKESFLKLSPEELSLIVEEFDCITIPRNWASMTKFLRTLAEDSSLGKSPRDRLSEAVSIGFPFFVKVVKAQKAQGETNLPPLNFQKISEMVSRDPRLFKRSEVTIDKDGMVDLIAFPEKGIAPK